MSSIEIIAFRYDGSVTMLQRFYYARAKFRRRRRLLFTSPAEVGFIRIMGGRVVTIPWLRDPATGFPFTIVLTLGRVLKREHISREVRVGKCFVDFGNDIQRAIEIDGRAWHNDVIAEAERDAYLHDRGWIILHIRAHDIWTDPAAVRYRANWFLKK